MNTNRKQTAEQKFWAAAGYLWIISLVVLAARKNEEFIRFHANQGLLLFVLSVIFVFIPIVGWFLNVIVAIAAITGIVKALNGEKWPLPLLAEPAVKLSDWLIKTLKI